MYNNQYNQKFLKEFKIVKARSLIKYIFNLKIWDFLNRCNNINFHFKLIFELG